MRLFYLFMLLLFGFSAFGQDWAPINSTEQFNYSLNNAGVITHAVKVDSVQVNGEDSVFFFNRVVNECDTCCLEAFEGWDPEELNSFWFKGKSNILGLKVEMANENWKFISEADSFNLQPYSQLNDSWEFKEGVVATVTSISEENILGVLDSMKYINLSNGGEITLSKEHGLITLASESSEIFDIIGIQGRNIGSVSIPFEDIFNFDEGDLFQYHTSVTPYGDLPYVRRFGVEQRIITNIEEFEDSIRIVFDFIKNDSIYNSLDYTYEFEIQTGSESQTFKKEHFQTLSVQPNSPTGHTSPFVYDKILDQGFSESVSGRRIMHYGGYKFLNEEEELHLLSRVDNISVWCNDFSSFGDENLDQLLAKGDSEGEFFGSLASMNVSNQEYFKGYNCAFSEGLGYISRNVITGVKQKRHMTGFIKENGDSEGVILSESELLSLDELGKPQLSIFPNPTSDELTISSGARLNSIVVYNSFGKIEKQEQPFGLSYLIHLGDLNTGIYFVEIHFENGQVTIQKFLKQ